MPKSTQKIKWRPAVKRVMKKAAHREAQEVTGQETPPFRYRWEHIKAVVKTARKLAKQTGADPEIVEAAAWLHDIMKYDARNDHPNAGAEFARTFLSTTNFPPAKIERVAQAIEHHMGLWRDEALENLEAAIVWDADKLTKLGATAAVHWLGGSLAKKNGVLSTRDLLGILQQADWQEKTVNSMHTEPARWAAQSRMRAYRTFVAQLESELNALDL